MEYELDCAVACTDIVTWNHINETAEAAVGRISDSAGTGFGARDMQWVFGSEEEANKAKAALEATSLKFEYIGVCPLVEIPEGEV